MLLTGLAMGSGMLSSAKTSRALAHLASVSWKGLSDPHSAEKLRHELTWVLPSLDFDLGLQWAKPKGQILQRAFQAADCTPSGGAETRQINR